MNVSEKGRAGADTARACIVYSLVPYLGILFLPAAMAFGFYTFRNSSNRRSLAGYTAATLSILAVQLFLWWLLYFVPSLGRA